MAKTARGESSPTIEEANKETEVQRAQPTEEEIAVRAYYIHMERGDAGGNPTDDWLQAERELTEGK